MTAKKRNKLEIVRDILKVIWDRDGKIKPTHILYKSNLSHQMMEEYLKELIGKGFIEERKLGKGRTYCITDKGRNYLDKYNMIVEFTSSFGLSGGGMEE
jgi:predicted transcriptional regulator